jgi:hypothetical protein
MSELTKQALRVENNQSFPNNNAGLITPTALRTFNENMIDSLVDEIGYIADSGSWNQQINALEQFTASASGLTTGSLLITASFASQNLTFTKGDGSQFSLFIPDNSGSVLPSGVVSGSSQIDYPQISNIPAGIVSGSSQITPLLPSGTVSGSQQVVGILSSVNAFTASQLTINSGVNTFTQSASGRLNNIELTTQSLQAEVDNLQSVTGSYATTGSNTFIGNQVINGNLNLTGSLTASGLRYPTTPGVADQFLETDGAGNLIFDWVKTLHQNIRNLDSVAITRGTPLYVSGSTGDNANVFVADANNPLRRPATLIAYDATLAPNATGTAIISGEIQQVNTNGFPAGTVIYLAPGGGYTATRPTGSASVQILGVVTLEATNGRGIVFNQVADGLPNIQEGYAWVGNSNGVPLAVTTGSLSSYIFTQNNTFTGTQTFNNIAVNGTASIAFLESVTGSAKIIGDAFIILNNDTPAERYAGIIVLDSGSAGVSASFQYDGVTNDWFYEYTGSDPLNFGVALFGPEYGTKGSPTYLTNNRLPKGDGGHHLNDSNISDDGSTVSINSNTQITGSLLVNGNAPLINSNLLSLNTFTESQQSINSNLNAFTSSASGRLNNIELTTASLQSEIDSIQAVTGSYITTSSFNSFSESVDSRLDNIELTTASLQSEVDNLQSVTGSYATTGSNTFVGNQIITGSVNISGSAAVDLTVVGTIQVTGSAAEIRTSISNQQIVLVNNTNSNRSFPTSIQDGFFNNTNPTTAELLLAVFDEPNFVNDVEFNIKVTSGSGIEFRDWDNVTTLGYQTWLSIAPNLGNFPDVEFKRSVQVTGSVNIQSTLTASLQQGYVWVGDANGRTTTVSTGSFGGGGAAFPFTGNAQISGSLGVTGSMSGFVNTLSVASSTASVNFNDGNMFVITLPTGSVTHFTPTNIKAGQTINIQISQASGASTGSVTFSPNVLFAGGADYQATATGSAIDLLTLVSLDGTNVLAASIRNFQ